METCVVNYILQSDSNYLMLFDNENFSISEKINGKTLYNDRYIDKPHKKEDLECGARKIGTRHLFEPCDVSVNVIDTPIPHSQPCLMANGEIAPFVKLNVKAIVNDTLNDTLPLIDAELRDKTVREFRSYTQFSYDGRNIYISKIFDGRPFRDSHYEIVFNQTSLRMGIEEAHQYIKEIKLWIEKCVLKYDLGERVVPEVTYNRLLELANDAFKLADRIDYKVKERNKASSLRASIKAIIHAIQSQMEP